MILPGAPTPAPGGIVKAEGLGDGSLVWAQDHRQASLDDATQVAELSAADVIIVSRNSDSGSYANDAAELAQWNGITAPFYSAAELEFPGVQNWTLNGVDTLTVFFQGNVGNGPGVLYVAVEDSAGNIAAVPNSNPAAVTTAAWTEWKIPLSSLTGVNPARVKKIYIGVGDRSKPVQGGAGRIYIDDIRVTKS